MKPTTSSWAELFELRVNSQRRKADMRRVQRLLPAALALMVASAVKIDHVVVLVMENRYDDLTEAPEALGGLDAWSWGVWGERTVVADQRQALLVLAALHPVTTLSGIDWDQKRIQHVSG